MSQHCSLHTLEIQIIHKRMRIYAENAFLSITIEMPLNECYVKGHKTKSKQMNQIPKQKSLPRFLLVFEQQYEIQRYSTIIRWKTNIFLLNEFN